MASKEMLKIRRWDVEAKAVAGDEFQALINPTDYTITRTVNLADADNKTTGKDSIGLSLKDLVFDGTGVVQPATGSLLTVEQHLAVLDRIVGQTLVEGKVAYPVVRLVWGPLYHLGRVKSLTKQFTLFAPDGKPLRAKVSMELVDCEATLDERPATAARDMTRQLRIDGEVRLPDLCFQAYNDTALVQMVARYNDLTSFRGIAAGTPIACPPVR